MFQKNSEIRKGVINSKKNIPSTIALFSPSPSFCVHYRVVSFWVLWEFSPMMSSIWLTMHLSLSIAEISRTLIYEISLLPGLETTFDAQNFTAYKLERSFHLVKITKKLGRYKTTKKEVKLTSVEVLWSSLLFDLVCSLQSSVAYRLTWSGVALRPFSFVLFAFFVLLGKNQF